MPELTPFVVPPAESGAAPEGEQADLLRAVDRLRVRIKRSPRLTEILQVLRQLGYRRLPPDATTAYDAGQFPLSIEGPGARSLTGPTEGTESHARVA